MRYITTASKAALVALALALSGCAHEQEKAVIHDAVYVPLAVATGCIATSGRPAPVTPLNQSVTPDKWDALAPGAKAETIRAQAGRRMNYEDADRAATSAC